MKSEGKNFKTIYYYCGNKLSSECSARLRATFSYIDDSLIEVSTHGKHIETCDINKLKEKWSLKIDFKNLLKTGLSKPRQICNKNQRKKKSIWLYQTWSDFAINIWRKILKIKTVWKVNQKIKLVIVLM